MFTYLTMDLYRYFILKFKELRDKIKSKGSVDSIDYNIIDSNNISLECSQPKSSHDEQDDLLEENRLLKQKLQELEIKFNEYKINTMTVDKDDLLFINEFREKCQNIGCIESELSEEIIELRNKLWNTRQRLKNSEKLFERLTESYIKLQLVNKKLFNTNKPKSKRSKGIVIYST